MSCYQTLRTMRTVLIGLSGLFFFVACGPVSLNQHPDATFLKGQGIANIDGLNSYVDLNSQNPGFRMAKVTTVSDPLIVKTQARSDSARANISPNELAKDSQVYVYWPLDVVNNHVKVLVQGKAFWVTYRSSTGRDYITLLEDIYLPKTKVPSSGIVRGEGGLNFVPINNSRASTSSADLERVALSSSALSEAHAAIAAVDLEAADVSACQFDPLVGNLSGQKNNCYQQIVISKDFRNFISQYGQSCAIEAGQKAFGKKASRVLFHSSGAGQVRRNRKVSGSSNQSTHSTGQAFDLMAISLFFSGDQSQKVLMHRNSVDGSSQQEKQNHSFYWAFTNCWRQKVQTQWSCSCASDKVGALTYVDNSAHYNHLHMSLPMCERSRYNVSCI